MFFIFFKCFLLVKYIRIEDTSFEKDFKILSENTYLFLADSKLFPLVETFQNHCVFFFLTDRSELPKTV